MKRRDGSDDWSITAAYREAVGLASIDALWRAFNRELGRRGVPSDLADDVTQEAWLRTLERRPNHGRFLRAWLRIVGLRALYEMSHRDAQRALRERKVARVEAAEAEEPAHEDSRLVGLVAGLPQTYREVISLRYFHDLDVDEIARRLGRTPGTIRSQIKRGLDRLRVRLESDGERGRRDPWAWFVWAWLPRRRPSGSFAARLALACAPVLVTIVAWTLHALAREPRRCLAANVADPAPAVATSRLAGLPAEAARRSVRERPIRSASSLATLATRSASGTVRLPDGTPVAGAAVWRDARGEKRDSIVAVTDAQGRFDVPSIEAACSLWATYVGWLPSPRTLLGCGVAGEPTDLVLASPRGRLQVTVEDADGARVSGAEVALDWSLSRPKTLRLSADGELRLESELIAATTDERGRVELASPHAPAARLRLRVPGRPERVDVLALTDGDSTIELVLPRAARLRGRVVDSAGCPVPRAGVELRSGLAALSVDADGSGVFECALYPGPFEARVREPGGPWRDWIPEEPVEAGERRDLLLVAGEDDVLEGTAMAAGQALAGALVLCTREGGSATERATVDSGGRFRLLRREPGEAVTLRLYAPSLDFLCERRVAGGEDGVVLATDRDPSPRLLALEFVSDDASRLPSLVELRVPALKMAIPFVVDASTRMCVVPVPRESAFELHAWIPGLGNWELDGSCLSGDEQRLRVPIPVPLRFQLVLPAGVSPDEVRAGMRVPGFGCSWVDSRGGFLPIRELRVDPAMLTAEAWLLPGTCQPFFHGPGLAAWGRVLCVEEGRPISELVLMDHGVEADVTVLLGPEGLVPSLALRTAAGWTALHDDPTRVEESRASFRLFLPPDVLELRASTKRAHGSTLVLAGEIVPGNARPSFSIELEEPPSSSRP